MADETSTTPPQGARGGGNREPGGFRIRLSDNEMRSARALQEAFRLRSTVAVLGFCVRTLGQMLEEGKLDELVEQQRAQPGNREGGRPPRRDGSERPRRAAAERAPRVDPFARPSRPAAAPAGSDEPTPVEPAAEEADLSGGATPETSEGAVAEEAATEQSAAEQPAADTTPAES
jgi:hypothetical protein